VFGFNKTSSNGLSFLSGATIHALAAEKGFNCAEIEASQRTSNTVFVLQKPAIAYVA
jgi:hypothetical protein